MFSLNIYKHEFTFTMVVVVDFVEDTALDIEVALALDNFDILKILIIWCHKYL